MPADKNDHSQFRPQTRKRLNSNKPLHDFWPTREEVEAIKTFVAVDSDKVDRVRTKLLASSKRSEQNVRNLPKSETLGAAATAHFDSATSAESRQTRRIYKTSTAGELRMVADDGSVATTDGLDLSPVMPEVFGRLAGVPFGDTVIDIALLDDGRTVFVECKTLQPPQSLTVRGHVYSLEKASEHMYRVVNLSPVVATEAYYAAREAKPPLFAIS